MLNSGPALLFALTGSQIKRWQVVSHSVARCANSLIFRFSSTKAIHSTREEKHRETLTSISSIAGFYFSVDCRRFAHRELKFASRWRNRRAFKSLTELSKMNLFYKTSVPVHACARAQQFQYRMRRDLITWNALSWTVFRQSVNINFLIECALKIEVCSVKTFQNPSFCMTRTSRVVKLFFAILKVVPSKQHPLSCWYEYKHKTVLRA